MKLALHSSGFSNCIDATISGSAAESPIERVVFDTRKILNPDGAVFFALEGEFRDGHLFLKDAYAKGIRLFVVSKKMDPSHFKDATFFTVSSPLIALQQLAKAHRQLFSYPVVGITGSVGKTIVKEWLYHCLSDFFAIVRSPKSYNSQLGVALSLLEMNENHQLALIEAGISQAGEMAALADMIQPTLGVFTAFGSAHAHNFPSAQVQLQEKVTLFKGCKTVVTEELIPESAAFQKITPKDYSALLALSPFQDQASLHNLRLVLATAEALGIEVGKLEHKIKTLPRLALRMETFEGINGNTIINDTYNADLDALTQSLEYQLSLAGTKKRSAIIGVDGLSETQVSHIKESLERFGLSECFFIRKNEVHSFEQLHNQVVLIKGSRSSAIERVAAQFRLKRHKTRIEINLSAVKANLNYWRSYLKPGTKVLAMVKASSYGSGAEKMASFLEINGVEYLGVAYVDEGIELRKAGIKLPILVMNADDESFEELIRYQLEPTLFHFEMLDLFVKTLIELGIENYPVHLKFDTGMRRLGFEPRDVLKLVDYLLAQPEILVKSVYSHLAESDNYESSVFTDRQIALFGEICQTLESRLPYPILKHILNTEGVVRFPEAQFDMVRVGIGLYGISSNPAIKSDLLPAIAWLTIVSQLKTIKAGESVGYNRKFVSERETTIAVIPVGYADGYRRSLSKGVGTVVIKGMQFPVIGSVCMDMIMVDVTNSPVETGDVVQIIGAEQPIEVLASQMQTIPYEVLTSLSKRLVRVYIEE